MDEVLNSNWFEKIVIQDPSVAVFTWLLLQFLVLASFLENGISTYKPEKTSFEQWEGYWIFSPTYAFDLCLFIYVSVDMSSASRKITSVFNSPAPFLRTGGGGGGGAQNSEYNPLAEMENLDTMTIGIAEPDFEGSDNNNNNNNTLNIKMPTKREMIEIDGGEDKIDGFQMSSEDIARESALNRSLANKWLWTFPSFFLASSKISFDKDNHYSWYLVFLPLFIYLSVFLAVAIKRENWTMRTQKEIDFLDRKAEKRRKTLRENLAAQLAAAASFHPENTPPRQEDGSTFINL